MIFLNKSWVSNINLLKLLKKSNLIKYFLVLYFNTLVLNKINFFIF